MKTINKLTMFSMGVNDVNKSKEFYTKNLGLKVTSEQEYGGNHWVGLELPEGGMTINIMNVQENLKPGALTLYFSSPNVEKAHQELAANGVKVSDIRDGWGTWKGESGKFFDFKDPDGNVVIIIPA